ncbi:MAG: hypothetical protein AAFN77_05120 [Planctomycetota bacterium]
MMTQYRMFKSSTKTWQTLFNEASEFANQLGPGRLISISHSCDQSSAVVVVWFWDKTPPQTPAF